MKSLKILCILAVATILLTPAAMMARSPKFNFSFNFDCLPCFCPPPPIIEEHIYVTPPPIIEEHIYVPHIERETTIIERDYYSDGHRDYYRHIERERYPHHCRGCCRH